MRTVIAGRMPILVAVAAALGGCARQAVVETDPRGGEQARARLEAVVRADLDTLRRAQAAFFAEEGVYAYDLAALGVEPSAGVRLDVLEADATGFSALATAGSIECGVFVGGVAPPRSYTVSGGVVACRA